MRRAAYWYVKARPGVTDNLMALKVDKRLEEFGDVEPLRRYIVAESPLPPGKRILLIMDGSELTTAKKACERFFLLQYDAVKNFDMYRTDYSAYHTIMSGSNNMDYWGGKEERKPPEAFQHLERFVNEGGHLIVTGGYNGRNMGHLKRFGISASYYQSSFFSRNGRESELLSARTPIPKSSPVISPAARCPTWPSWAIFNKRARHRSPPILAATAPSRLS